MAMPVLLLAGVLATSNAPTVWTTVQWGYWTADGSAFLSFPSESDDQPVSSDELGFALVMSPDGKPLHLFRDEKVSNRSPTGDPEEVDPKDFSAEARGLWQSSESEAAYASWKKQHPPQGQASYEQFGGLGKHSIPGGKDKATVEIRSDGKKCPKLSFIVELGTASGTAAEFPCPVRKGKGADDAEVDTHVDAGWSPDGTRLAVLWTVTRTGSRNVTTVFIVSRRGLASIDLLSSGAGSIDTLATKLEDAGFRLGHRGKSKDIHPVTEVFYAPKFEAEAREVAKLAGAASANVKPLSWKSPYAITVAVGAAQ